MDPDLALRFGLLLVRPGMVVAVAPGVGGNYIPGPARVGFLALLAIGLLPNVEFPAAAAAVPVSVVIAREAAIGLAIALVVRALIAGAEFAGHLAGYQIGFSYGATIDPQSGVNNTMLATFYGLLATVGFFAVNGHHAVLRALAASYAALPIGAGQVNVSLVAGVRDILGLVFVVAVRLAAPVVVVLLIVELALGLISRVSPALSSMVIGAPIRIVVGLLVLALTLPTIPRVTASLVQTALRIGAQTAGAFR
ncbi:MAG: flagellar biosynthetic protein FliR [Vicinamibacterales bacterium]